MKYSKQWVLDNLEAVAAGDAQSLSHQTKYGVWLKNNVPEIIEHLRHVEDPACGERWYRVQYVNLVDRLSRELQDHNTCLINQDAPGAGVKAGCGILSDLQRIIEEANAHIEKVEGSTQGQPAVTVEEDKPF